MDDDRQTVMIGGSWAMASHELSLSVASHYFLLLLRLFSQRNLGYFKKLPFFVFVRAVLLCATYALLFKTVINNNLSQTLVLASASPPPSARNLLRHGCTLLSNVLLMPTVLCLSHDAPQIPIIAKIVHHYHHLHRCWLQLQFAQFL